MPFRYQYRHPLAVFLLLFAACGGDDDPGIPVPNTTLESVEVSPLRPTIFSLAPDNTVSLTVVAKDGDGNVISSPDAITYESGNTSIATVSASGVVTAAGAGTTSVTATATEGDVSRSGSATITVRVAPAEAGVSAQLVGAQPSWVPGEVDVGAGGQVTWTVGTVGHDITFTSTGAPSNVPEWSDGSVSVTFPAAGTYQYVCTIHFGMVGSVRVH
jgi:plastocyanin